MKLRQWLTDIFASAAPAVLTISFGLSYSVLIFSGPLAQYFPYGIAATFTATAIIATVVALGSTFPFAIGAPETSTAAVTGILTASLIDHILAADPSARLLGPVLLTLSMATIITGIVLCSMGLTRIGRAIRRGRCASTRPYAVSVGGHAGEDLGEHLVDGDALGLALEVEDDAVAQGLGRDGPDIVDRRGLAAGHEAADAGGEQDGLGAARAAAEADVALDEVGRVGVVGVGEIGRAHV